MYYLFEYLALQCYNQNATNIPGELDTNIVGMTLNPLPPQTQSNSCNTGSSSHRKDNRYSIKNNY